MSFSRPFSLVFFVEHILYSSSSFILGRVFIFANHFVGNLPMKIVLQMSARSANLSVNKLESLLIYYKLIVFLFKNNFLPETKSSKEVLQLISKLVAMHLV